MHLKISMASSAKPFRQRLCRLLSSFLLAGFSLAIMSCAPDEQRNDISPAENETDSDIQLRPVDEEEYRKVLAEHQGNIVVVDFWATWCPPCVESFPDLVDLSSEFRDKEVTVIGASVDFPGSEEEVKEFLRTHEADFPQLFVEAENSDDFIASVSPQWDGGVPAVFVYDREGEMVAQYTGSAAIEQAEEKLLQLLD